MQHTENTLYQKFGVNTIVGENTFVGNLYCSHIVKMRPTEDDISKK